MIVFEIRNKAEKRRLLGYLFYYERSKRFFTEILEELDEWNAPFIFAGHIKRGIYSIDSIWSRKFVSQRIIPTDRQNLGSILKANGLKTYDEYKLLQLSEGRCAQDELYIVRIQMGEILPQIRKRLDEKVMDVMALQDRRALVFFRDGKSCIADMKSLCGDQRIFGKVLSDDEGFRALHVSPGGNGVEWDEERYIPSWQLRSSGIDAGIIYEDLIGFIKDRLIDTAQTTAILNCSRQYVNQLVDTGCLHPVREGSNSNIYLRSSIETDT